MKARNVAMMIGAGAAVLGAAAVMNNRNARNTVKKVADKAMHEINKMM